MTATAPADVTSKGTHRGLITLAGTEMWERFSFYGLQVILAYYLYYEVTEGGLGMPTATAVGIAGAYGGLVYIAQIAGGWVADRLLAPSTVVMIGATLIMAGHISLAVLPSSTGLITGLSLIVIGAGGLKVNTTMMVGQLYPDGGAHRDAGYSIYYMGITIGAFLGPVVSGWLQVSWGFHMAFAAAAAGMALGLITYVIGRSRLPQSARKVAAPASTRPQVTALITVLIVTAAIIAGVSLGAINADNLSTWVIAVVAIAAVVYFVSLLTNSRVTAVERARVRAYIPFFGLCLVFWTMLFQMLTSLAVYMDTRIDLSVAGIDLPPSSMSPAHSLLVAFATPALAALWSRSGERQLSSSRKVVLGIALIGAGLVFLSFFAGSQGPVNAIWIAGVVVLLFSIGESVVAPTILSLTSAYAPRAATAQMTSLFFLTMAGGSTLSGVVAQHYSEESELSFFLIVGIGGMAAAGVLYVLFQRLNLALPHASQT